MKRLPRSPKATLLATDSSKSIITSLDLKSNPITYTLYGYVTYLQNIHTLSFNGSWFDTACNCYHLGHGRRLYSPSLYRFYSADSISPFAEEATNAYVYCNGDPVNYQDPSGYIRVPKWILPIAEFIGIAPKEPNRISALTPYPDVAEQIFSRLPSKDLENFKKAYPEYRAMISEYSLKKAATILKSGTIGNKKTLNSTGLLKKEYKHLSKINEIYFTNNNIHKDNTNWKNTFTSHQKKRQHYEDEIENRLADIRTQRNN